MSGGVAVGAVEPAGVSSLTSALTSSFDVVLVVQATAEFLGGLAHALRQLRQLLRAEEQEHDGEHDEEFDGTDVHRAMVPSTGRTTSTGSSRIYSRDRAAEPTPDVAVGVEAFDREPAVGTGGDGDPLGDGAPDRRRRPPPTC